MPNLKYIVKRIAEMDYKAMVRTARTVHGRTGKNTLVTLADMVICGFKYQAGYMDYLVFEFYTLTAAQRKTYITRGQNNRYVRLLNPQENWHLLEDKVEFLKRFDGFHGRDWIDLRETSQSEFAAFCETHPKLVVKPLDGTCGHGIEFFEISDKSKITGLYDMLMQGKQYLVEDLIVQHPDISRIYPLSVNTLRLVTIKNKDTVHVVFSSIRIGNGKRVDNLNSGGMASLIDIETGKISTPGADKEGKAYFQHPMTGVELIGVQIPMFHEAVDLVKRAAMKIPELGYIAWDVAVTDKAPIIIEANHFPGHDIYQFQVHLGSDKLGLVPRFDKAVEGLC
ncbi:sugar-transfer associated ATP-grasp domain-containing protein [Oscillospiraceae bacterium PP1C4]